MTDTFHEKVGGLLIDGRLFGSGGAERRGQIVGQLAVPHADDIGVTGDGQSCLFNGKVCTGSKAVVDRKKSPSKRRVSELSCKWVETAV